MKLHEAMELVLRDNGGGWMERERIAEEIARRDLFRKPSTGDHPSSFQVCARARSVTYRSRFECSEPGCHRIRLREPDASPDEVAPTDAAAQTPRTPALTENDVIDAVCSYLEARGYEILARATTHQRGVDITARKGDRTILVEAKGGTSSKKGTNRYGKPFSSGQVTAHVSRAFYTAAALKSTESGVQTAIALPASPRHEQVVGRILPSLRDLKIGVFWVDRSASVELESTWKP